MNRKFQKEVRTVFSNVAEKHFNPWKKFYGIIKVSHKEGDVSYLTEYESKFRSTAVAIFEEEARLCGGKLTNVGAYN